MLWVELWHFLCVADLWRLCLGIFLIFAGDSAAHGRGILHHDELSVRPEYMFDPPDRFSQHSEASFWRSRIHRLQILLRIDELVLTGITVEILGKGHGEHFGGADAALTNGCR